MRPDFSAIPNAPFASYEYLKVRAAIFRQFTAMPLLLLVSLLWACSFGFIKHLSAAGIDGNLIGPIT